MTEQESSGTAQGLGEDFGRRFVQGVQRLLGENAEALGELDRRLEVARGVAARERVDVAPATTAELLLVVVAVWKQTPFDIWG